MARALVLVGFMGAGKSSAARALADDALDADAELERRTGRTVAELFAAEGEAGFRAREEALVLELLARARDGRPVALGGGAVGSQRVRAALRDHAVVWLEVSEATAWSRVRAGGGAERPLAADPERFRALLRARTPLYEAVADAFVPEGPLPAAALRRLARAPGGTRLVWARAAGGEYAVWVGEDLDWRALWPLEGAPALVTDATVGPLYAERVGEVLARVEIAPGEEHKTLSTAQDVWRALARAGLARDGHVAALGGGVVGDLAGFCAATYQRGVPVVQVPTTVVAQVDSAYGGKTGVDLPEGKNYVGAFHQPAAVLADTGTLASLPPAERAAGYAEVLKTALIAGGALWARVSAGEPVDAATVLACARTKLAVVAADERDAGARQLLNLGHTVGHAIETATRYARYRHGEAVGLGLLAALRLSGREELRAHVADLLASAGLPTRLEGADPEAVVAATARDKKRRAGVVPFVLVDAPGDVRHGVAVDPDDLRAAVGELAADPAGAGLESAR